MWYEASAMMVVYVLYFTVMFQNPKISRWVRSKVGKKQKNLANVVVEPPTTEKTGKKEEPRGSVISAYGSYIDHSNNPNFPEEHRKSLEKYEEEEVQGKNRKIIK